MKSRVGAKRVQKSSLLIALGVVGGFLLGSVSVVSANSPFSEVVIRAVEAVVEVEGTVDVDGEVDVRGSVDVSYDPSVVESIRELGSVFLANEVDPATLDLESTHYITSINVAKYSPVDEGPLLVSLRLDGETTTSMTFREIAFVTLPMPVAADEVQIVCFSTQCTSGPINDGVIVNGYPAP